MLFKLLSVNNGRVYIASALPIFLRSTLLHSKTGFRRSVVRCSSEQTRDKFRALALWSACENSYLSWTRNAVICVVAGGSLFIAHDKMQRASLAGIAFVDLGLLFAFAGTTEHIMTSVKLFRLSVISPARLLWVCNYTVIIMSVWLFGVSRLIGYKDQLQYLSASVPRFTTYFDLQRTKPKSSSK